MERGWYEETALAAAGLWTTATDLARFVLGLRAAWLGESGAVLTQETAQAMLTPHLGGWGIGVPVAGEGDALSFGHGGNNPGYASFFLMYPATGDGIVVLTNGTDGGNLAMEVVRAAATTYGWAEYQPEVRASIIRRFGRALSIVGGAGIAGLIFLGWKWTRRPVRAPGARP